MKASKFGAMENAEDRTVRKKLTNEQVLELIEQKRRLLNNIPCRKANFIGHILRRNCLLHCAIEGQMTTMKGVGRRRRMISEREEDIGEEAEDRKNGKYSLSIEHKEEIRLSSISPKTYQ